MKETGSGLIVIYHSQNLFGALVSPMKIPVTQMTVAWWSWSLFNLGGRIPAALQRPSIRRKLLPFVNMIAGFVLLVDPGAYTPFWLGASDTALEVVKITLTLHDDGYCRHSSVNTIWFKRLSKHIVKFVYEIKSLFFHLTSTAGKH